MERSLPFTRQFKRQARVRVYTINDCVENPGFESFGPPRLKAACDYHMERIRDTTDVQNFEFDRRINRIHSAEILALLRLRQLSGSTVPEIDHPGMVIPVSIAIRDREFQKDQLLERITSVLAQSIDTHAIVVSVKEGRKGNEKGKETTRNSQKQPSHIGRICQPKSRL